jgi:hypothetical protein
MGDTNNLWTKFDNFCITRLQYSPTTLDERKRKLRHLQNKGIDLINFDPEEIYPNPLLMSCRPNRDKCVRSTPGGDVFVKRT